MQGNEAYENSFLCLTYYAYHNNINNAALKMIYEC